MLVYKALARSVILESIRRKDLWVVAILGFLIVAASGLLGFFGVNGLEIFAKDISVTVLGGFSTVLAILVSSRVVPEEIKNRTLYPLLARPITRLQLLVGKFFGAVAVSWISFTVLLALTCVAMSIFGVAFSPVFFQYALLKMMGLVMVCGLAMTLSIFTTPSAGATISMLLCFGSTMIVRALLMANGSTAGFGAKALSAVLPQVQLFDIGGRFVYPGWGPVPAGIVLVLVAYSAAYSSALVSLSWLKFRRQSV
jgi:ABC-type transport system involved in multi-copper enzyme maturation permease subunit